MIKEIMHRPYKHLVILIELKHYRVSGLLNLLINLIFLYIPNFTTVPPLNKFTSITRSDGFIMQRVSIEIILGS